MSRTRLPILLLLGTALAMYACRSNTPSTSTGPPTDAVGQPLTTSATLLKSDDEVTPLPLSEIESRLPPALREVIPAPFTGDLDEMVRRRVVRVGVTFNRTFYFVDKGVQRGVSYEYGQLLEDRLNTHFKTGPDSRVLVVFVPLPREMLASALIDGMVDVVAAQVTIRPELRRLADFSDPTRTNVTEIVVTGPGAPPVASVDDLSGRDVFARPRSACRASLVALNAKFAKRGKLPVVIRDAPENLEDDDLLEMVNAGLLPAIVVDDYLAKFWSKVLPNITLHENVAVRTGGALAVAVRKKSPKLLAALNTIIGQYGLGTAFGNQVERKYLADTKYVRSATSESERAKFVALIQFFRQYGEQYELDFTLMAAQGYQESQLNQDARSRVGAIGIMQVMPETGKTLGVGDISKVEPNIHAGVKYVRLLIDRYYKDEPMDTLNKGLFAFAAYNAGPGRVRQLREEAKRQGLDPNVWFGNVEQIASERIGRETVVYVSNIYKYYIAYRLVLEETERRAAQKAAADAK